MSSTYRLTLTSEGANSGPYYVVTYTTASIYGPVQAGSPVFLPNVGDSANVTIVEDSASYLAFKLTNNTSGCEYCNNNVIITITGSAPVVPTASLCCAPTITNVAVTASSADIYFTTQSGCADCVAITAQTSSNGVDWGNNTTSGCTSPITVSTTTGYPTGSYVDFRLQMTCSGSTSSSYSDIFSWVTGSGGGGGGGGTGSICSSSWTVRNASCGFGTVNDIGINGFFMNTLSGPSTFPLSSTLYGYKSSPNGVNCTGSNTIQANVTTNLPGTGNCGAMFIYINNAPAPSYTKFFTSDPFPFISGVVINSGDTVEVMISCLPGSCPQ